jgi:hypothetical protein
VPDWTTPLSRTSRRSFAANVPAVSAYE